VVLGLAPTNSHPESPDSSSRTLSIAPGKRVLCNAVMVTQVSHHLPPIPTYSPPRAIFRGFVAARSPQNPEGTREPHENTVLNDILCILGACRTVLSRSIQGRNARAEGISHVWDGKPRIPSSSYRLPPPFPHRAQVLPTPPHESSASQQHRRGCISHLASTTVLPRHSETPPSLAGPGKVVSRVLSPIARVTVISLGCASPRTSSGHLRTSHPPRRASCGPHSAHSGLAPAGVYRAIPLPRDAGGLLPHRFTLTATTRRSVFCCTFRRLHQYPRSLGPLVRRPAVSWQPALWSPDFPHA
jgi:hypothetical protein